MTSLLRYIVVILCTILYTSVGRCWDKPESRIGENGPNNEISSNPQTLLKLRQQFAIDSDRIVTTPELKKLSFEVDSVLSADSVIYADIRGYASIDGPVDLNVRLAKGRALAMSYWLKHTTHINPDIIRIQSDGEDWAMFERIVNEDADMPDKSSVLRIIGSEIPIAQKQKALKGLQDGKVWKYLSKYTLPKMRIAELTLGGFHKFVPIEAVELPEPEVLETVEEVVVEEPVVEVVPEPVPEYWTRKIYIKTNAPAWLMLWVNAAFEIDLAPHWSFAVPVYYSGWNYFTSKLKFRTFSVVPEVRWWPRKDNMGFFLNGHLGLNQFNYAKGGDWRYQTWHGHSPALGGGVGIGYRWYFCKNHRWSIEASVGAGIYHLDYSIFENIHNGLIVGRRIRTFYGIDQAALSFVYSFGVQRKEVKK